MNANELADYLDNSVEAMLYTEQPYLDQAAIMLRQQQAEIEALKYKNDLLVNRLEVITGKKASEK